MKKILSIIPFLCLFLFPTFAVNFEEALKAKTIQVLVAEVVSLQDKDFSLSVKNISGKPLRLVIPAGSFFQPEDSTLQPRFTAKQEALLFAKNETRVFLLNTVCANAIKRSPLASSIYQFQVKKQVKLNDLSDYLQHFGAALTISDIQNAVWSVTNQHRIEGIADEALKKKMATITGQQIQPLRLTYKHENIPGQVAYRDKELRVEGLFRYGTDSDITAHLGLYDKDGKLVKMLRPNMLHRRGQHSFRFDFVITNVKPGDFFIRLTTGNNTLNEMKVTFS